MTRFDIYISTPPSCLLAGEASYSARSLRAPFANQDFLQLVSGRHFCRWVCAVARRRPRIASMASTRHERGDARHAVAATRRTTQVARSNGCGWDGCMEGLPSNATCASKVPKHGLAQKPPDSWWSREFQSEGLPAPLAFDAAPTKEVVAAFMTS